MKTTRNTLYALVIAAGLACSPNTPPPESPQEPELPAMVEAHIDESEFYVTREGEQVRYFNSELDLRNTYGSMFRSMDVYRIRIHDNNSEDSEEMTHEIEVYRAEVTGEIDSVPFIFEDSSLDRAFPQEE